MKKRFLIIVMVIFSVWFMFADLVLSDAHNEPEPVPVPSIKQEVPDTFKGFPYNHVIVQDDSTGIKTKVIVPEDVFNKHELGTGQIINHTEWTQLYNNGNNHYK